LVQVAAAGAAVSFHTWWDLTPHDQIANVFARRPNQDTAAKFHSARNQAFTTWAEVTGVAMAA
jgi:hypothetical protein